MLHDGAEYDMRVGSNPFLRLRSVIVISIIIIMLTDGSINVSTSNKRVLLVRLEAVGFRLRRPRYVW